MPEGKEGLDLKWCAFCLSCGHPVSFTSVSTISTDESKIERNFFMRNGQFAEAYGRVHLSENPTHNVIIGYKLEKGE